MAQEIKHTDISELHGIPDLLRLAQEVQATRQPRVLTQEGEELVVLRPAKRSHQRGIKGQPTSQDDPIWNIIGIATDPTDEATDVSANKHKYLAEAYLREHR